MPDAMFDDDDAEAGNHVGDSGAHAFMHHANGKYEMFYKVKRCKLTETAI